ncbi:hypothetical protein [Halosolutus gelatinilyticus]|uniref:hypothetical protein n=1 Tax=Halosolutus gelatinilyticus TaxID=2931975 RepID=UPI001FF2BFD7|nr:hypothetical protein [Halosolutus gelatinilyticus]
MTGSGSNDRPDSAELRETAAENEEIADALQDLREEVVDEPIGDTRLADLYGEAATSRPDIWNTVTAFIDVEDGEAIVTDESKLAEGKWAPEIVEGCDAMLTVDVGRMSLDQFAAVVDRKLAGTIDDLREEAAQLRSEAEELESEADGTESDD